MSSLLVAEAAPRATEPQPAAAEDICDLDTILVNLLVGSGGDAPPIPDALVPALLHRMIYHGVAGLIASQGRIVRLPPALKDKVREMAVAQTMWELRHAAVMRPLLSRFAEAGIPTLFLKGTALAYDLYENPAERARCDSDMLICERHLKDARVILKAAAFLPPSEHGFLPPSLRSQESWWLRSPDGTTHSIDLHWRPLNAPALNKILSTEEMFDRSRPLPRLAQSALAPDRPKLLLHACLHRSLHDCAPYQVGSETYFGGNRLIWLWDITLLGRAMSDSDWDEFRRLVHSKGVGDACAAGLLAASERFSAVVPAGITKDLTSGRASSYFAGGQLRRAWLDWVAIPGVGRKLSYLRSRGWPDEDFMRAKYPKLSGTPVPLLRALRIVDLVRRRS